MRFSITAGGARAYLDCVRRDAVFHGFVAAYALAGLLLGIAAGAPHKFVPLSYIGGAAWAMPRILLLVLAGIGLWSLRGPAPWQAYLTRLCKVFDPQVVAGLLLFASLSIFMGVFTSIKTMLPDIVPFFADPYLADLDDVLHGRDPWLFAISLLPPQLTPVLEGLYFPAWSAVLSGSMLAVLLAPKLRHLRTQYVCAVLIIWPLLGNVLAGALMSAGPVYYERVTGEVHHHFAGLADFLARHSLAQPLGQKFLWKSYMAGEAGAGSGISAFPSLHLASATLAVLLAHRVHPRLMWVAVAYCTLVLFASVHLGWHYAVDGYFSIAATVLIWRMVGRTVAARRAHFAAPASTSACR